ncbi:hypothetical protein BX600DRAFT_457752 [Xylariales sp. PMI_506]|nr:hypothetical protein BX600DRAFT_457752 [Xylariales sp. PMI_506]
MVAPGWTPEVKRLLSHWPSGALVSQGPLCTRTKVKRFRLESQLPVQQLLCVVFSEPVHGQLLWHRLARNTTASPDSGNDEPFEGWSVAVAGIGDYHTLLCFISSRQWVGPLALRYRGASLLGAMCCSGYVPGGVSQATVYHARAPITVSS